ncbi:MAG: monovalent cation/H+ antiporter complex subunit F [Candidatus Marinimicrobia bacterium]|nr:monovalent cation/H+ antiporter complex subunit F [Candidatus Neomarinimicrobiota bacterium]
MADILYNTSAVIALIAIVLAGYRSLKGPNVADRVVALDVMTIISISLIVYVAALAQRIIYLDVAMVYALISFIGVIAIARYLERGL